MEREKIRSYEVSIWTLQDSFISVLKRPNLENKGQIEDGLVTLKTDGTQELSFQIPMYVDGIENPAWYSVKQGYLIENLRKIKIIFNKDSDDKKVFEFLITSVKEKHESDQLYCEVKTEGLAFNELSKRGFKCALNSDDYYMDEDVAAWYDAGVGSEYQKNHVEPIANIQYWLNKFLKPLPQNSEVINPNIWYYEIQMNWDVFPDSANLSTSKIYDEEYATTWKTENDKLVAATVEPPREKSRLVDLEESNYYNITQKLAEAFGVFCKYVYEHDENNHITCRKVVFYNNFYIDDSNYLDLTYPYSAESITREKDSTDLTTKLYIKSVDDKETAAGVASIIDAEANPSGEDYILNFDYLHEIGTITEEQYEQVKMFEAKMHNINEILKAAAQKLVVLQEKLPALEAQLTIAKNAAQLDRERIEDSNALFNALTNNTGIIQVTEANPASAVLLQDSSQSNTSYYYIKITEQGVDYSTVRIYKKINYAGGKVSDEISTGSPQYDDYGNLIRINNIYANATDSKIVYLTYTYSPKLYYENIKRVWETRLAKDEANASALTAQIQNLNTAINNLQAEYDEKLKEKQLVIQIFEEELGPAIREGYWQPEDYTNYGNRFIDSIKLDMSPANGVISGLTPQASFIWDKEYFIGEQESNYKIGADTQEYYYPYILLSKGNSSIINNVKDHLGELSFLFFDFDVNSRDEELPDNENLSEQDIKKHANWLRSLSLGSQCQLAFIKDGDNYRPIILLTGEKVLGVSFDRMRQTGFLGKLTSKVERATIKTEVEFYVPNSTLRNYFVDNNSSKNPTAIPRIKIDSLLLKNSSDELSITYDKEKLSEFEDYSVASRDNEFYITLKPEALIKQGEIEKVLNFYYTLSNAATAIYLDGLQVSRENAYPQVSYEISPNVYGEKFMRTAYNYLGALAHINDIGLKFENVQGYISELELDLDEPWEDKIKIQNYKNKFEDLFSTIVAQTEAIKSAAPLLQSAAQVLTLDGTLSKNAVKDVIRRVDLDYAFNNGALTIDDQNGIWGTSDSGVVAFRGGGIFTATEKNENGDWKWNTGITPEGINADLITTGQLDTNRIRIYAGDEMKFQMNSEGIFAYRSILDNLNEAGVAKNSETRKRFDEDADPSDIDNKQYVKYDKNGLFLIAEPGAYVLKSDKQTFVNIAQTVNRVEVSWDGLKLRDWANNPVFYADPDTGNLTLKGSIIAANGNIGGWEIGEKTLSSTNIVLRSGSDGGIFVSAAGADATQNYTITYNEQTYYAYRDNAGNVFYYKEKNPDGVTVSSATIGDILKLGNELVSVTPVNAIKKDETKKETKTIEIDDPDAEDGKRTETIETEYTYTVYYVAKSGSNTPVQINGEPLVYNQSNSPYAAWYQDLINASWYKILSDSEKKKYVRETWAPSATNYVPITTSDVAIGTTLSIIGFQPALRINAKDGSLETNSGQLGSFKLTANALSNGNLSNVTIGGDSHISSSYIENYSTNSFPRAFCDIIANGDEGTFTLTRIDGTTANFNITTMKKYQNDMVVQYNSGHWDGEQKGFGKGYTAASEAAIKNFSISPTSNTTIKPGNNQTVTATLTIGGTTSTKSVKITAEKAGITGSWSSGGTYTATVTNKNTNQSITTSITGVEKSGNSTIDEKWITQPVGVKVQMSGGGMEETIFTDSIRVDASSVYNAGKDSVEISSIDRNREDVYVSSNHNTTIWVLVKLSNDVEEEKAFEVSGSSAYSAGTGAMGVSVDTNNNTVRVSKTDTKSLAITAAAAISYNSSTHKYMAAATAKAGGTAMASQTALSGTEAYDAGVASVSTTPTNWQIQYLGSGDTVYCTVNGKQYSHVFK